MSDRNSKFSLMLTLLLYLTACVPAAGTVTALPPTDRLPFDHAQPKLATQTLTPEPTLVASARPKAKDLLFIEFFAIT